MKISRLKCALAVMIVLFGVCSVAHGMVFHPWHKPEIDPNLAVSSLTLLAGTLAVLRVRRRK